MEDFIRLAGRLYDGPSTYQAWWIRKLPIRILNWIKHQEHEPWLPRRNDICLPTGIFKTASHKNKIHDVRRNLVSYVPAHQCLGLYWGRWDGGKRNPEVYVLREETPFQNERSATFAFRFNKMLKRTARNRSNMPAKRTAHKWEWL